MEDHKIQNLDKLNKAGFGITLFFSVLCYFIGFEFVSFLSFSLIMLINLKISNPHTSAIVFITATIALLSFITIFYGGYRSPSIFWFSALPVLSYYLLGKQTGTKISILATIILLASMLIGSFNWSFTIIQDPKIYLIILTSNIIGTILIVGITSYTFVSHNSKIISEISNKNKELANVISEKSHLISIISHDISNPLISMIALPEIALRKIDKYKPALEFDDYNQLKGWMNSIERCSQIIATIIEDTRELESIKSGKKKLKFSRISLNKAFEEVANIFDSRLIAKGITLEINIDKDAESIIAHENSFINSVLNNIVSNAIKFSFDTGTISISTAKTAKGILIKIEDAGLGIPRENQVNIFSLKNNVSTKGTNDEKGSGFGMPIVKDYMTRFGANIAFNSNDHVHPQGTQFRLLFPE